MSATNEETAHLVRSPSKVARPTTGLRAIVIDRERRQELRVKAIDETFDADRRRIGERVAVIFRWLFLIVLAVLNNVTPARTTEARVEADIVLGAWAVMNVVINVLLLRGFRPGKQFSLSTMTLDILFAAGLVYLSNGFSSPFFLALFLAVITNAVRFGATASVISALVIAFIYLFVGGSFTPANFAVDPNATIGKVFLFLVVALATGYMTRELERERRLAVERAAQADTLRELSSEMVSGTDIKDVSRALVENAVQMTKSARGRLILASPEGFEEIATATRAGAPTELPSGADPFDQDQLTMVSHSGEAAFALDRKGLTIPITSNEGVTALLCLNKPDDSYSNQDLFNVTALSGSSAVPLANALRYHRSTQEAITDHLTGLVNVREFRRRLDAAFARPDRATTPLSLLLVDFDHFKSANDQLGHQHGDLVLQLGARIVREAARSQDLVARYGGDELAVMVADANGVGAQRLAYRIVDSVHAAAVPTTPGKKLTFSIGVASYPEDALTAQELVSAADQALYLAKREGKDRACTFPQLVTELELATDNLGAILTDAGPQVVVAAAHAVDHRNPVAQGHSSRIADIADTIGRRLSMPAAHLEDLRTAAFLHDVGHLRLATDADHLEAPGHAEEGEKIVREANFSDAVAVTVRHHHDRWDGGGVADALVADNIPLGSRILSVAEAFEAMTAGRACERLTAGDAVAVLTGKAGTEFDGAIIEVLGRCIREGTLEGNLPAVALPATAS